MRPAGGLLGPEPLDSGGRWRRTIRDDHVERGARIHPRAEFNHERRAHHRVDLAQDKRQIRPVHLDTFDVQIAGVQRQGRALRLDRHTRGRRSRDDLVIEVHVQFERHVGDGGRGVGRLAGWVEGHFDRVFGRRPGLDAAGFDRWRRPGGTPSDVTTSDRDGGSNTSNRTRREHPRAGAK